MRGELRFTKPSGSSRARAHGGGEPSRLRCGHRTFSHPHYELIATGLVFDGESEVRDYFRGSRAAFPDQRNELLSLRYADDAVIVEFILLGTHKGTFMGIEPTGRSFRCQMTAFFIFEDEGVRMTCERVYFDGGTILRQITEGAATT